ncbi:MAG: hypothetical protein ACMXYF_04215 [Candidatus Woesearchaeota archaeon]
MSDVIIDWAPIGSDSTRQVSATLPPQSGSNGGSSGSTTFEPFAIQAGGSGNDEGWDVKTLADGSAIITGFFQGTATFGALEITSAGWNEIFVAKVDANGEWEWVTSANTTGAVPSGRGVDIFPDGSAIVTGGFSGNATFGSNEIISAGGTDIFVAKIDSNGDWVWATTAGGSGDVEGRGITILSDNSAVMTGYFEGTVTFGSNEIISQGGGDIFVARIDSDGNWMWVTNAEGSENFDTSQGIDILSDNSAIITGLFRDTVTFGSYELTSVGGTDVFVARIDSDGDWVWAMNIGGIGNDVGLGVSSLSDDSILVTGAFENTVLFGSQEFTATGDNDIFVARIGPDGSWD